MKGSHRTIGRLAIEGGEPVRRSPLPVALGGAMLGDEEKRAVIDVLDSRSLFRYYGPDLRGMVDGFERELAATVGCRYALAVSSGTAGLRASLVALGIGPGDEVLVPAYSFLACPAAVITCGALPVFVECDESLLLDPVDLEAKISDRCRAILVVHNNGACTAMEPILALARRRCLRVIEDCAQALGATHHGRQAGSFGDIATFSLQYLKVITSGEGGGVLTDDRDLHERAVLYHDLGFQRPGRSAPTFPGENLRMSELAGAVALAQLRKLPGFLDRMRRHRRRLVESLRGIDQIRVREGPDPEGDQGASLILQLTDGSHAQFFRRAMRAENIPCDGCLAKLSYGYPAIQRCLIAPDDERRRPTAAPDGEALYAPGICPRTETILRRSVCITVSPALSEGDVDDIVHAVDKVAAHVPD